MSARGWLWLRVALIVVVVAGLAVDVYVHFDLASSYDLVKSSVLSQGELFRVEGAAAILAAVGLLARPRRYTAAFAFLVTAGGFAAVVVYRYVNVGKFGPIPDMYEPTWYGKKTLSAWAEGVAALAAAALFIVMHVQQRRIAAPAAKPRRAGV
jgi:hypothetical protein